MSDEELPPSKLGTKAHWDEVYDREVRVFEDVGDEGEVWFGESSVSKMRSWANANLPPSSSSSPLKILECGSGNGTLLLSFLTSPEHSPSSTYHLTGIDYSPKASILAAGVEASRRETLEEDAEEEDQVINHVPAVDWRVGDLLRDDYAEEWDLVMDKGTFDALCLSDEGVQEDEEGRTPSLVYPERVARLVKQGGYFLITSCNFTEEEIKRRWTREGLGFTFHSAVPHPSFTFGGKQGTTVCTVAFTKTGPSPRDTIRRIPNGHVANHDASAEGGSSDAIEPLYICIDCGGTKTDVAIASSSRGIIARASGGTGNMAEVGLQRSYEIVCTTVLEAVGQLPKQYTAEPTSNGTPHCPVSFADIWVGVSGCDTPIDQQRMSDLLGPFFGVPKVAILNDAHLLGGALLRRRCPWGVAVIAGTGSVIVSLAVNEAGEIVQTGRRGGMGYILGDEGSAFDLGRHAIRLVVEAYDEGREVPGGLAQSVRDHFGVQSTSEVLAKVYDLDPTLSPGGATNQRKLRISALSRQVLACFSAPSPDTLAVQAVQLTAASLIDSIAKLVRHRQKQDASTATLDQGAIMMGGGLIRQEAYRRVILDGLRKEGIVFRVEEVSMDVAGEGVLGLVERAKANVE